MAQSNAWASGRNYVIPDDVKSLAVPTLAHRLVLEPKARYSGITKDDIVKEILENTKVPI